MNDFTATQSGNNIVDSLEFADEKPKSDVVRELNSAIYTGTVRHRRYTPKNHEFTYRVFMVYLDLKELDQVFSQSCWWSNKGFSLAWFRRKDFFDGKPDTSLYDAIANKVEQETQRRPTGAIRMLTNLRYFGFIINPITCYYCFDATGEKLETVVAEVTNTPWGQRCHYVLDFTAEQNIDKQYAEKQGSEKQGSEKNGSEKQIMNFIKSMHVSPFQPMDLSYQWQGKKPGDNLLVHLDVLQDNQRVLDATLVLQHQPMTKAVMHKHLFRYPWMTLKVFAAIYWQAIRLWLKRIPFYGNPKVK